jgi:hypothetical protein
MTTEWDLVCERVAWKTVAKLVLFTGILLHEYKCKLCYICKWRVINRTRREVSGSSEVLGLVELIFFLLVQDDEVFAPLKDVMVA